MDATLFTFAALALFVVMTPGPTVLLALSNGSRYGVARAGYGIAGAALSDAILITAAGLGLGAVLAASATLFALIKWIGVAYLIYLGLGMLRSSGALGDVPAHSSDAGQGSARAIFRKSLLVAVTNPKGYLFFTAFLPQFLTPAAPLFPQYLMLAGIFIAVDIAVMIAYASLGANAIRFLKSRGALWIDRICGALLIAMGLALSLVRRAGP